MEYVLQQGFLTDLGEFLSLSLIENKERAGMIVGNQQQERYEFSGIDDISDQVELRTGIGMFETPTIKYGDLLVEKMKQEIEQSVYLGTIHTHVVEYDTNYALPPADAGFLKKTKGVIMSGGWSPYSAGKYSYFTIGSLNQGEVETQIITLELDITPEAIQSGNNIDKACGWMYDPWD